MFVIVNESIHDSPFVATINPTAAEYQAPHGSIQWLRKPEEELFKTNMSLFSTRAPFTNMVQL